MYCHRNSFIVTISVVYQTHGVGWKVSKIEELIAFLEKHGRHFYHFTDARNIESIKKHGILSTSEIRSRDIPVVTGGNQWSLDADKIKGVDKFVHLCFFRSHP